MGEELTLWIQPHPQVQMPFDFDSKQFPQKIKPTAKVGELIERIEDLFNGICKSNDIPFDFQIQVLWNIKDAKKALNPSEQIGAHFVNNESFGIYGDFQKVQAAKPIPEEDKTPVTILTGFLGAGKTTLLNYILREQREKKIAVIENEFGEVSIDDALLKQDKLALAEKVIVMDNGCMCCTIRGDLEKGLRDIMDEMVKGNRIDAIIIETTGMADPVPIVRTFMTNPFLTSKLRLDGIISLADAKHLEARLDDKVEEGKVNEAYQQIAFADKIILNKLDLVTSDEAIRVKNRIREINKFAKVLPAVKSKVKLSELSDMRAHDMTNFVNFDLEAEAAEPKLDGHGQGGHGEHAGHGGHGEHGGHGGHGEGHGHGDGHEDCKEDHGHGGHGESHGSGHGGSHGSGHIGHGDGHGHDNKRSRHDSRVNSFSIVREGEILPQKLGAWMQSIGQLTEERGTIFRIKAILAVKGHPYKHVFHAVMDVSDEDDAGPWAEGEKRISKIVFIGKSMDQKFLRDGFQGIFE